MTKRAMTAAMLGLALLAESLTSARAAVYAQHGRMADLPRQTELVRDGGWPGPYGYGPRYGGPPGWYGPRYAYPRPLYGGRYIYMPGHGYTGHTTAGSWQALRSARSSP
jgi:hypothetical protein